MTLEKVSEHLILARTLAFQDKGRINMDFVLLAAELCRFAYLILEGKNPKDYPEVKALRDHEMAQPVYGPAIPRIHEPTTRSQGRAHYNRYEGNRGSGVSVGII
ncbi:MAG: hypothetical protein KW804_00580 [Candidatus Doudnabacteria bacterium]|nr:hypothetical protein [Candidatus Doudnabacteria bacterium]